jgi:hypothetical protein
MAIIIEANYSKKLGLSAYSSHSYSVTIRSEVADLSQVDREGGRLLLRGAECDNREDGSGHATCHESVTTFWKTQFSRGARGGSRTRTGISPLGILSPVCLPFHHSG